METGRKSLPGGRANICRGPEERQSRQGGELGDLVWPGRMVFVEEWTLGWTPTGFRP